MLTLVLWFFAVIGVLASLLAGGVFLFLSYARWFAKQELARRARVDAKPNDRPTT